MDVNEFNNHPAGEEPAFRPIKPSPAFAPAAAPAPAPAAVPSAAPTVRRELSAEPSSVFAEGLPAWDIEPPQIVVRRR